MWKISGRDKIFVGDDVRVDGVFDVEVFIPEDSYMITLVLFLCTWLAGWVIIPNLILFLGLVHRYYKYDMFWIGLVVSAISYLVPSPYVLWYLIPALIPRKNWKAVALPQLFMLLSYILLSINYIRR